MKTTMLDSTRCANILCSNRVGEGTFTLVEFRGQEGKQPFLDGRIVQLLLCAGCEDAVRDDLHREHEEH